MAATTRWKFLKSWGTPKVMVSLLLLMRYKLDDFGGPSILRNTKYGQHHAWASG